jgi:1,4-dihydroxy-2-naphthoate octaprenyltransferase
LNKWVLGARVRTLPAALAPVLVGTSFATKINWINACLALIVSLSLQIAVNFSNDYSDGVRGTDANRVGPTRLVASGLASAKAVRTAAFISFVVACIAGTLLSLNTTLWLILVGAICVLAAWGYTGGKRPYGYFGFGEFSVFTFFGLVATIGSYYVQTQQINWQIVSLSIPIGSLSCAILVINNLRDLPLDQIAGKQTLAVKFGDQKTRYFYAFLLIITQLSLLLAVSINKQIALVMICLPLVYKVLIQVLRGAKGEELIEVLGKTARVQLITAVLISLALYI